MKRCSQCPILLSAFGLAALVFSSDALHASVTLDGSDEFIASGNPTGDLTVSGDLSVVNGIDFGTTVATPAQSAVLLNYVGGSEKAVKFDIIDAAAAFMWRDNLIGTARDKMLLDANNLLSLYNSTGTAANITLNGNNGQINLEGTGCGVYANGNPVFTINSTGNAVLGNVMESAITSKGFLTSATATADGFLKQSDVNGMGFQTAAMVNTSITSKGFLTSSTATADGFLKQADIDAKGYQTASDVSVELASRNLVTVSNIGATLESIPQVQLQNTIIQGDTVLDGKVTISQVQGDISMGSYQ